MKGARCLGDTRPFTKAAPEKQRKGAAKKNMIGVFDVATQSTKLSPRSMTTRKACHMKIINFRGIQAFQMTLNLLETTPIISLLYAYLTENKPELE
jgi:hypothetical protein